MTDSFLDSMNCTSACPRDLNPTRAIGKIKAMPVTHGT